MQISPYHGNFAAFALILVIPFALYMFATKKPPKAAMIVCVGVMMWGPESVWIRIPSTPILNLVNVPALGGLLGVFLFMNKAFMKAKPGRGPEALMWLSLLASLATWKTNTDVQIFGTWIQTVLPGLSFVDGMSMGLDHVYRLMFPFLVGRIVYQNGDDLETGLKLFVVMALIYVIPILVELKMSPRVHEWIYGYAASNDFLAVLRWGGYRPMVCMPNGLALSLLMLQMLMAAAAFQRAGIRVTKRMKNKTVTAVLSVILVLCKSTGAIMYGIVFIPLILKGKLKSQLRLATILSVIALSYPTLRAADLVPVDDILAVAESISKDRAGSLAFRFKNEKLLGDKARERFWFGWGSYGRNSIYHDEIGKEMTIADGYWVILLGVRGFAGFALSFGLALWPVFVARKVVPRIENPRDQWLLGTLSLIVAVSIFDLIPNGLFTNYNYFLSGMLYGACKALDPKGPIQRRRRRTSRPSPVAGTPAAHRG
ncbi:MAG: hypothetical protein RIT81_01450 [Deltaproteobacteria bacterium]